MTHSHRPPLTHIALTFVASVIITGQSSVNSEMTGFTKNPTFTAVLVFVTGLVSALVVVIVQPKARQALRVIPRLLNSGVIRWWHLLGGLSGATFVLMQSDLVSVTGVAVFTIAAVAGQTTGALVVDKFGFGPAGKQAITFRRVVSALVGIFGVVLSVIGSTKEGQFAFLAVTLTFLAGCFVSIQPALNGQVAVRSGHAMAATVVNFIVGLAALGAVLALNTARGSAEIVVPPMPWENPLVWLGGPFGVFFVMVAASMARTLGVFVFTLTSVMGQLSGAILMNFVFPDQAIAITPALITGLVLTG
ncbi:MAG: hypothetical protein F2839_02800, partial [Actinobacteria bacterium]|nr:hypothetical protein [Actinomycetota bacterium]